MKTFVIDAGIGNVGSVLSMLKRIGRRGTILNKPAKLASTDRLILPGVGAFDAGIGAMAIHGIDSWIRDAASSGNAILGICLGMQLLFEQSEEGKRPGLGLIQGTVVRLQTEKTNHKLPHIGWNTARPTRSNPILPLTEKDQRFYFVHSYCAKCTYPEDSIAETEYGCTFTSAVGHDKIFGVQFHPEKSHRFGLTLLERFVCTPFSDQPEQTQCYEHE